MKVLGKRVLIEQTMVRKKSALLLENKDPNSIDNFDMSQKIIQVGSDCPIGEINEGDTPILGKYSEPSAVKVIEKSQDKMITHIIMDYDNIVGVDTDIN